MKQTTLLVGVIALVIGIVIGGLACKMIWGPGTRASIGQGTHHPTPIASRSHPITPGKANSLAKLHNNLGAPVNGKFKAFTIDKAQLNDLNDLATHYPDINAFRIYMGRDNSGAFVANPKKVGMVVCVDGNGKDTYTSYILMSSAEQLDPCPPICDAQSTILDGIAIQN